MVATSRLAEFHEAVKVHAQRAPSGQAPTDFKSLLEATRSHSTPTRFAQLSRCIGTDIRRTTAKLDKLSKLARRKSLFDDPTVEIQELTYIIKQDINLLNNQIRQLRELHAGQQASSAQAAKHDQGVVKQLMGKLATTGRAFQQTLKERNRVMEEQQDRMEALRTTSAPSSARSNRPSLFRGRDRNTENNEVAINMIGSGQSLEAVTRESSYYQDRAVAVENLEGAIEDVAEMFVEFAGILEEQRELVARVDDNIDDALANVEVGQSELVKFYSNMSSNRGLIFKIFLVLMVFMIIFVVFVA